MNGDMEEWRNGGTEKWRNGGMEECTEDNSARMVHAPRPMSGTPDLKVGPTMRERSGRRVSGLLRW
jgi:hypothetical protein